MHRGQHFVLAFPLHKTGKRDTLVQTLVISNPSNVSADVIISFPKMASLMQITRSVAPLQTIHEVLDTSLEVVESDVVGKVSYDLYKPRKPFNNS